MSVKREKNRFIYYIKKKIYNKNTDKTAVKRRSTIYKWEELAALEFEKNSPIPDYWFSTVIFLDTVQEEAQIYIVKAGVQQSIQSISRWIEENQQQAWLHVLW